MSSLSELLVLLHDAHSHVDTLYAECRDWTWVAANPRPIVVLQQHGPHQLRWDEGGTPWGGGAVMHRRLWFSSPCRLRVELLREGTVVRAAVRDGIRWWRWDQQEDTSSGEATKPAPLPPLLDPPLLTPARLLGWLRLTPTGTGERANRPAIRARGTPRRAENATQISLRLEFDAVHGTLLGHATVLDGLTVELTEVLEIRYNEPIGAQHFDARALGSLRS